MARNLKLFLEMTEPFNTQEEMNNAIDAFFADLQELRKKHKIANCHVVTSNTYICGEVEAEHYSTMMLGDSQQAIILTAVAFGAEKHRQEALIGMLVKGAKQ